MERVHILVKGYVQGIGYRYFVSKFAVKMGLNGWVRNLINGDVEIEVEGERDTIQNFIHQLRVGHRWAEVTDMIVTRYDNLKGYRSFEIRF